MNMDWSNLNHLQLGKYGEYLARMEFIKHGFDVYSAEVDDKGIDFVVRRKNGSYSEIQVKAIRNNNYVFMRKEVFQPRANLFLALVVFTNDELPLFSLIPSLSWRKGSPTFLVDRDFEGKKSKPEYGVNISQKTLPLIREVYSFEKVVNTIR